MGLDEAVMSSAAPIRTADHLGPMLKIDVIIGSTRPGTVGKAVGGWTYEITRRRKDAEFALLDIATCRAPSTSTTTSPPTANPPSKGGNRQ
jgi:hypothetical protein